MLPLRSLNNNEPACVQFQNQTLRNVDIVWINYRGGFERYVTLKPREAVDMDTFKTHPWIFVDHQTGVKMRVGFKTVFYPPSNREIMRRFGVLVNQHQNLRIPVPIRLPLFTLRQISLQSVVVLLKDVNDVDNLELPQTLKTDIRRFCLEKNEIFSKYV